MTAWARRPPDSRGQRRSALQDSTRILGRLSGRPNTMLLHQRLCGTWRRGRTPPTGSTTAATLRTRRSAPRTLSLSTYQAACTQGHERITLPRERRTPGDGAMVTKHQRGMRAVWERRIEGGWRRYAVRGVRLTHELRPTLATTQRASDRRARGSGASRVVPDCDPPNDARSRSRVPVGGADALGASATAARTGPTRPSPSSVSVAVLAGAVDNESALVVRVALTIKTSGHR